MSQTLIRRALEQDLLVGTTLASAVGPCPRGAEPDRHEFLLRIRFLRPFWRSPQVTPFLISTQPASHDPAICALSVHTVTADGFTLALSPRFGSPRIDVECGWVAVGEMVPARGGAVRPADSTAPFPTPLNGTQDFSEVTHLDQFQQRTLS